MLPSVIVGDSEGIGKFEAAHCDGVLLKPGHTISNCPAMGRRVADILKLLVSACAPIELKAGTPVREKTWRRPIGGIAETKVANNKVAAASMSIRTLLARSSRSDRDLPDAMGRRSFSRALFTSHLLQFSNENRSLHRAHGTSTNWCNSGVTILAI